MSQKHEPGSGLAWYFPRPLPSRVDRLDNAPLIISTVHERSAGRQLCRTVPLTP
jgi:hypothetical protein